MPSKFLDYLTGDQAQEPTEKKSKFLDYLMGNEKPPVKEPVKLEPEPKSKFSLSTKEFYSTSAASPLGVWSPAMSAMMGSHGFGPTPEGGFSELGVPLDKEGKPYAEFNEAKGKMTDMAIEMLTGMNEQIDIINSLGRKPFEAVSGTVDFALSMPGFITGILNAAGKVGKEIVDQIVSGEMEASLMSRPSISRGLPISSITSLNLEKMYNKAAEAVEETMVYFESAKKPFVGEPTPESQMIGQIAMAPVTALSALGHTIAEWEGFANHPNIRGAAKFTGDIAGFAVLGMLLHGKGKRIEVAKKLEDITKEADSIIKKEQAIEEVPSEIIKQAQKKVLEAEKHDLELRTREVFDSIGEDALIREEMGRQAEEIARAKMYRKSKKEYDKIEKAKAKARPKAKKVKPKEEAKVVEPIEIPIPRFGNTNEAVAFGREASETQVAELRKLREESVKEFDAIREKAQDATGPEKKELIQNMVDKSTEAQFYREAIEGAEGAEYLKDVEPITKTDQLMGVEVSSLKGEKSPFFQTKEEADSLGKLYAEREKAVNEDVELYTQKLLNDVNKWYHGDEAVDIAKGRDILSKLSARADEFRKDFMVGEDHLMWKETVSEAADWARGLERPDRLKIEPSGIDLPVGIPLDKVTKLARSIMSKLKRDKLGKLRMDYSKLTPGEADTVKKAEQFYNAFEASRRAKNFDMDRFLRRSKIHTYRALHEQSGILRRSLIKNYGQDGHDVVKAIDAESGATGHSLRMQHEMRKEAYKDVPSNLSSAVDAVNLVQRLEDIYGYKSTGSFKPPKGMSPAQTKAFGELIELFGKLTPAEKAKAVKASNILFDHVKMWIDDMVEVGLKSPEEGELLKAHNYRKIRSVNVQNLYDQKYKVKLGDKLIKQSDSGIDFLGKSPISMIETDTRVLYNETANRIYRRIDNQKSKLSWVEFDTKHVDNPYVIIRENDKILNRPERKVPKGWIRDYWYKDGKMKTMYFHPDVALQVMSKGGHMSYQLTRVLTNVFGINLVRSLAVGTSAAWAITRGLTMDLGHTFFSARIFDPAKHEKTGGKRPWKKLYSYHLPVFLGQIGKDMTNTFHDVFTQGPKTGVYMKHGGMMPFLAMRERAIIGRGIKPPNKWDRAMNDLSFVSKSMEMWNRVAVTERALKILAEREGITLEEAWKNDKLVEEAVNVAVERLPYNQGGWLVKETDKVFGPFISASYNANRTFLRAAKENPVDFAARVGNIAVPTVGLTIASILYATEAWRDTPEHEHTRAAVIPFFPDSLNFIDEDGNKRYINLKFPLDPMMATMYNIFRGLTQKMLYETGKTDIEPNYKAIVNSIVSALPADTPLSPTLSAWFAYFKNIEVWRDKKVVPEKFNWPDSGKEGKFDTDVSQIAKDISGKTDLSAPRLEAAAGQLLPTQNEYVWAIGKLYDAAFNDLDPRLRRQHWAITLSKTPGLKNLMSVTVPRAYRTVDRRKIRKEESLEGMLRNDELNFHAEGFYWRGVGSEEKIDEFIGNFEEEHIKVALERKKNFIKDVAELPNRNSWSTMFHTSPEAKAKDYFKIWKASSDSEKMELEEVELEKLFDAGYVSDKSIPRFYDKLIELKSEYHESRR